MASWRRATDEPLEARFNLFLSKATLARLKRQAGAHGVSASEYVRGLIAQGLEADEAEEEDNQ